MEPYVRLKEPYVHWFKITIPRMESCYRMLWQSATDLKSFLLKNDITDTCFISNLIYCIWCLVWSLRIKHM